MKICKHCGEELRDAQKYCSQCGAEYIEEEVILEPAENEPDPSSVWYYIVNSKTAGPVSFEEMKTLLDNGTVGADTYVWTAGMENWELAKNTALKSWIPSAKEKEKTLFQPEPETEESSGSQEPVWKSEKSILLYVVLTIVTCGLFGLYWQYSIAKETNDYLQEKGQPLLLNPLLVVVFNLISGGLYLIYWFYKAGKALKKTGVEINVTLLGLLSLAASIVALAIYQDELNEL